MEGVAELHEADLLVGGQAVHRTAVHAGVVGQDAHRSPLHPGQDAHHRASELGPHLEHRARVDDAGDQAAHVVVPAADGGGQLFEPLGTDRRLLTIADRGSWSTFGGR